MKSPLSLQETIEYVKTFHESFRVGYSETPTVDLKESIIDLRHKLMAEENEEYLQAAKSGDLVEVADALGDMLYILCGTIITHGLQHKIEEVYHEIQQSNLSKLDANGEPIYREDGKVMKSDQYFRPDIAAILEGRSPKRG
ncbi:nucleoside triphosphate pyrophosphohydrolase family protein [bacterium SCSIO 12741]|nr:nucleoside triphosphate pyrophosphohydrolase family protein [bacterium SCSIO 12741]